MHLSLSGTQSGILYIQVHHDYMIYFQVLFLTVENMAIIRLKVLYPLWKRTPRVQKCILLPRFYDERSDQAGQSDICQSFNIGNTEVLRMKNTNSIFGAVMYCSCWRRRPETWKWYFVAHEPKTTAVHSGVYILKTIKFGVMSAHFKHSVGQQMAIMACGFQSFPEYIWVPHRFINFRRFFSFEPKAGGM